MLRKLIQMVELSHLDIQLELLGAESQPIYAMNCSECSSRDYDTVDGRRTFGVVFPILKGR